MGRAPRPRVPPERPRATEEPRLPGQQSAAGRCQGLPDRMGLPLVLPVKRQPPGEELNRRTGNRERRLELAGPEGCQTTADNHLPEACAGDA